MSELRALVILDPGPLALVEDGGRVGHLAAGVSRAGAADQRAYALANRLVGNSPGAAVVEVTAGGLRARAQGDLVITLTGAPAEASVGGRPVAHCAVVPLPSGATLSLGMPSAGLRTYLAVRGGIDVTPVLGSRSSDTLSGLGPAPLRAGMLLPVGSATDHHPILDHAPVAPPSPGLVTLTVTAGPRHSWFEDPSQLTGTDWSVSGASDRRGIRLLGGSLERAATHRDTELASEAMVPGAIQVPHDGEPVILLRDHPATGGYPVIAVVRDVDLDLAAQLIPGQKVRFSWEARDVGRPWPE